MTPLLHLFASPLPECAWRYPGAVWAHPAVTTCLSSWYHCPKTSVGPQWSWVHPGTSNAWYFLCSSIPTAELNWIVRCMVYGGLEGFLGMCFPNFSCLAPNVLKWKQTNKQKTQKTHKLKTVFRYYGNKTWVLSLELLNSYLIVDPGSEWWMRRTSRGNGFFLVVVNTLLLIIIQTLSTMFIASLVFLICCPGFVFLLCWQWKCHLHCLPPDTALLFLKNHLCTGGRRLLEIVMAFWQSQSSFQVKSYLKKSTTAEVVSFRCLQCQAIQHLCGYRTQGLIAQWVLWIKQKGESQVLISHLTKEIWMTDAQMPPFS